MINESIVNIIQSNTHSLTRIVPHMSNSIAIGSANGTFGELLQGVLPVNNHFLVTFPIAVYSKSIVIPDESHGKLEVYPAHKTKTLKLAEAILKHFKVPLIGKIIIKSELEEGKGLASSSADLVATAKALEQALNVKLENELLLELLRKIEPTDGVMYPGFVAFYHRKVQLIEYLGHLPTMTVVAIDEGGEIDTITYNKKNHCFTDEESIEYAMLLKQVTEAVKSCDLKTIGNIATRSAVMHQKRNQKKHLNDIMEICQQIGGLGVIVAHSGTYIGIILENNDACFEEKLEQAIFHLSKITCNFRVYETVNYYQNQKQYRKQSYQNEVSSII